MCPFRLGTYYKDPSGLNAVTWGKSPSLTGRKDIMSAIWEGEPPEGCISMGDGHMFRWVYYERDDTPVGLTEWHRVPDGSGWCVGGVYFSGRTARDGMATWEVESMEPLTLSPSILCLSCGNHGWIREGVWVTA